MSEVWFTICRLLCVMCHRDLKVPCRLLLSVKIHLHTVAENLWESNSDFQNNVVAYHYYCFHAICIIFSDHFDVLYLRVPFFYLYHLFKKLICCLNLLCLNHRIHYKCYMLWGAGVVFSCIDFDNL